jgi:luciferase family oxidoreductase group 1
MKQLSTTPLSILDLVNYPEGKTIPDAFQRSKELAQKAEAWGYLRFWMAEHHNLNGIASSATPVLISYIAGHTKSIRVGSGGIMLPNHAPLLVAEQFGTLALLYPQRIDLGLGRAPGTDPLTTQALRRDPSGRGEDFADLLKELEYFLSPAKAGQKIKAIPGAGVEIPIWILGSSLYSAHLAARIGRPYAFAGHFAPHHMMEALKVYRSEFQPSKYLSKPHAMVGVAVVASNSDEEALFQATSVQQRFLSLVRGQLKQTPPPIRDLQGQWTPTEESQVRAITKTMVIGGPGKIQEGLQSLIQQTQADELIITSDLYNDSERMKSFEIIMSVARQGDRFNTGVSG